LASEDYNTRRKAAGEIGAHGEQVIYAIKNPKRERRVPGAVPARVAFDDAVREREERIEADRKRSSLYQRYPTAEQLKEARLVNVLKLLGDDEAKAYTEELAAGWEKSVLVVAAQAALQDWPQPAPKENPPGAADWQPLLRQLSGEDEEAAFTAISQLALSWDKHRDRVREELLRLAKSPALADPAARLPALVKALDAVDFKDREEASRQLALLGRAIEPELRAALESAESAEAKQRLQTLLAKPTPARPNAEQMLALRLIEAGELSGADNRAFWQSLAHDANNAWLKQTLPPGD
jgi:hypothetical protein